ncbi:KNL1 protein, partial [Bucco capensis]|nr:KNL1 protein [Bucco capensis]
MEKIDADPTMENENTEHIRGKRLSSILKASRLPLDDLGNGNELTQDITIEKRRKTLRRVSFANTIKVFERDLKSNTAESTGMNTLLHAPIQAPVQQTEGQDADSTLHRLNRHDSTVLFSEENEMDMTSSHTAVITGNLISSQDDQTRKIDFTSFLASLNSSNANSETSKEFPSFPDPTEILCPAVEQKEDATAVKKINLNEFLMSLTSTDKAANSGPEEEDVFCIPSQASEDITQSSAVFVYSHEPMDTCNVTKVFRGQEDGMEMTKCLSVDAKAVFSAVGSVSSETVFRGDQTLPSSKGDDMDITGNYTDVIHNDSTKEMKSCQNSDRQEKTHVMKVVNKTLPAPERGFLIGETTSSEEAFKAPHSADGLSLLGANLPEAHKFGSQLPLALEKSVVFPSGESMDLTGNCVVSDYRVNVPLSERKAVPGYQDENKTTSLKRGVRVTVKTIPAVPAHKTVVFSHNRDDMEITASHTTALN